MEGEDAGAEELRKSTLDELLLEDDDDDFAYEEVDVDVDAEEEFDDAASEDLEAALRSLQHTMGRGTAGALGGAVAGGHAELEPGEVTQRPEVRLCSLPHIICREGTYRPSRHGWMWVGPESCSTFGMHG